MNPKIKPLIGLPCGKTVNKAGITGYDLKEAYVTALLKCGALPVLIPVDLPLDSIDMLLHKFDGFLLSGGADIDPSLFGGEPNTRVYGVNATRDNFEIALVNALAFKQRPLLCICRGTQVLNVAMGGTLYTDIASQVPDAKKHDWFPGYARDRLSHKVFVKENTRLYSIIESNEIHTNSLHHQSIKLVGKDLTINACAEDGIIEGIELTGHVFMIGVQWHPEWLQSDPLTMKLFQSFVDACLQP